MFSTHTSNSSLYQYSQSGLKFRASYKRKRFFWNCDATGLTWVPCVLPKRWTPTFLSPWTTALVSSRLHVVISDNSLELVTRSVHLQHVVVNFPLSSIYVIDIFGQSSAKIRWNVHLLLKTSMANTGKTLQKKRDLNFFWAHQLWSLNTFGLKFTRPKNVWKARMSYRKKEMYFSAWFFSSKDINA